MNNQAAVLDVLHEFAQAHEWTRVKDRVQALAKVHLIDGVAAILAGAPTSRSSSGAMAREPGENAPGGDCAEAAYAYAFSGRRLDFDDVQTTETATYGLLTNPTVPVLAAALAVGQAKRASGEALLNAYLIGVEVAARLAAGTEPMNLANRLRATTVFGGVGALVASARLLDLDRKQLRAAYDLWQLLVPTAPLDYESSVNVAYRDAHSVRMAVEAAFHAQCGAQPDPTFFGPLSMVTPNTVLSLSQNLGKPYCILEPGFAIRVYPCDPLSHPALDATLAIVNVHGVAACDIERIDVGMTSMMMDRLSTEPPSSIGELRRSVPYVVAVAACKGSVEIDDFAGLPSDPELREVMGRVNRVVDPQLDDLGYERARSWVNVVLKSGRAIGLKLDVAKGSPQKRLSQVELSHKFLQCALPSIPEACAENVLNRLWALEAVDDVTGLLPVQRTTRHEPSVAQI